MPEAQHYKPNHLINEKSPYLLQHAYNPVDWYPWGEEAFNKAVSEDKLIFLSIGYATCHWCHVMERESFENKETADILNESFVSIKVDREERPDIDNIYMDAIHALGIQGGWPLNMFLTPDKAPLVGGTYFPPTQKYGRRSFKEVLLTISDAWISRKAELLVTSSEIRDHLTSVNIKRPDNGLPSEACFKAAYEIYNSLYDHNNFGFKTDLTNKFPPSMALSFLMNYYFHTKTETAQLIAEQTLSAMKRGGIYDQIGGGLCRYSTDHSWLVPHFEKMLYDNSLFLKALAEGYQFSGKEFFREAAYDVINYVRRDLSVSGGGIASAEDADSEGEEGKFYIWSLHEFRETTGTDSASLEALWNVTQPGNFEGMNILNEDIQAPILTQAEQGGAEWGEVIRKNREKLFEKRNLRIRPFRDDKVLTSWNCLYIQGLIKAGVAFGDNELISNAEDIYIFIVDNLFDSAGRLMRRYRDGESGVKGYLSDYAELGLASIELFRATFDLKYIEKAESLAEDAVRLFSSDFGPFYETGTDNEELIRRSLNGYDGVEPSGNSSIAKLLLLLSAYGLQSEEYTHIAEGIFKYFKDEIEKYPTSCPALLDTYMFYTTSPVEISLIAKKENPDLKQSLDLLTKLFKGNAIIALSDPDNLSAAQNAIPILKYKTPISDFTAYICTEMTCKPPVSSYEQLQAMLSK